jgi:hypothetical protein
MDALLMDVLFMGSCSLNGLVFFCWIDGGSLEGCSFEGCSFDGLMFFG